VSNGTDRQLRAADWRTFVAFAAIMTVGVLAMFGIVVMTA
jgi:hypothetical protein